MSYYMEIARGLFYYSDAHNFFEQYYVELFFFLGVYAAKNFHSKNIHDVVCSKMTTETLYFVQYFTLLLTYIK